MPIGAAGLLLPSVAQAAVRAYGGSSPGVAALGGLVALLAFGLALWAQLAVIALTGGAPVTRPAAARLALARLPRALLVVLIAIAAVVIAALPIVGVLLATGYDVRAAAVQAGSASPLPVSPGAVLFCLFYGLALLVAGLWIGARLFLVNAVVLNESRGIGALPRSFALTRGRTMALIGVALLFALVYAVSALAAQWVVFIIFRLILGARHIATASFLGGIAGAAVGAAWNVVVAAFAAQLYAAATRGRGPAAAAG